MKPTGRLCLFAKTSDSGCHQPGITLRYSQQIPALVDEARMVVAGEEPQGLFSLGALESTAAVRIPALLAGYNQRYPKIQFALTTGPSGAMLDGVLEES